MRTWDKSKPPLGPFALNQDSEWAKGLIFWTPLNGGGVTEYDLAGNYHLNTGVAPTRILDHNGAPAVQGNGSSMYLARTAGIPPTTLPLTIACWYRPTTLNAGSFIFGFGTNAVQNETMRLYADNTGAMYAQDYNVAVGNGAASKTGLTAGRWQHLAGVFVSTTSRTAYLNGAAGSANGTNVTHANLANLSIGAWIATGTASVFMDGAVAEPAIWNYAMSAQQVLDLNDPGRRYELWYPLRSRKWISIAGGPVALTGNVGTSSTGTLVPSLSLATTGNSATASRGTVAPTISLALTGNAATASVGTVTPALSLALTGQAATAAVGSVGLGGTTQALTGNSVTASVGTVTPALSLAVTGNAATSAQGAIAASLTVTLAGQSSTSSAGTPVASLSLALSGNSAATSVGTVTVPGVIVPAGQSATASAGQISPGLTVALTGNGATSSVGTMSKAISLALSGLAGTSSAGIVVPGLSKALTGNAATATTGSVAVGGASVLGTSVWWTYDVPVTDMRYTVPAFNLRYDVDSENLT